MVLSDQRTPYSIMYVWAAFEAKSPPTQQDLVTLINNYTLYFLVKFAWSSWLPALQCTKLRSSKISSSECLFLANMNSELKTNDLTMCMCTV